MSFTTNPGNVLVGQTFDLTWYDDNLPEGDFDLYIDGVKVGRGISGQGSIFFISINFSTIGSFQVYVTDENNYSQTGNNYLDVKYNENLYYGYVTNPDVAYMNMPFILTWIDGNLNNSVSGYYLYINEEYVGYASDSGGSLIFNNVSVQSIGSFLVRVNNYNNYDITATELIMVQYNPELYNGYTTNPENVLVNDSFSLTWNDGNLQNGYCNLIINSANVGFSFATSGTVTFNNILLQSMGGFEVKVSGSNNYDITSMQQLSVQYNQNLYNGYTTDPINVLVNSAFNLTWRDGNLPEGSYNLIINNSVIGYATASSGTIIFNNIIWESIGSFTVQVSNSNNYDITATESLIVQYNPNLYNGYTTDPVNVLVNNPFTLTWNDGNLVNGESYELILGGISNGYSYASLGILNFSNIVWSSIESISITVTNNSNYNVNGQNLDVQYNPSLYNGYATEPNPVFATESFYLTWYDGNLPDGIYSLFIGFLEVSSASTLPTTPGFITFLDIILPNIGSFEVRVTNYNNYNITAPELLEVQDSACFCEGSEILCIIDNEEKYIKVQHLKIGNIVKTYNDEPKKIIKYYKNKYRNDKSHHQICKISNYENQTKDLYITGGHSILVDELTENEKRESLKYWNDLMKIKDKYLLLSCVNENAKKINDSNIYTIYHIVLENDDIYGQYGIYANGILTESMSIDCYESIEKKINKNIIFI